MATSKRRIARTSAVLVAFVALLTGCVSARIDLELHDDDTLDLVMAISDRSGGGQTPDCTDPAASVAFGSDIDVEGEQFTDAEGHPGCRLTARAVPISEFGNNSPLQITRDGDAYTVSYSTNGPAPAIDPNAEIVLNVTFPGEITDAGSARVEGTTATWDTIDQFLDGFSVTGSAKAQSGDPVMWIAIIAGLGFAAAGGAAVAVMLARARGSRRAEPGTTENDDDLQS